MAGAADSNDKPQEIVEDYLEVDNPIPGQNYVCMSFVSPEEVIADRHVFMVNAFLKTIAKNYDLDEKTIQEKYKDFLYLNEDKLVDEYSKAHNFQTSVRGVKIRGTYDTLPEAQRRAKLLQKTDPVHNVFVGQVGYWLPWDPQPHKVAKQEYAEKELNELIHKYEENQEARKIAFNKRVEREMEEAKKKSEEQKKKNLEAAEKAKEITDSVDASAVQKENVLEEVMEQNDAWSQRQDALKKEGDSNTEDKSE